MQFKNNISKAGFYYFDVIKKYQEEEPVDEPLDDEERKLQELPED